MLRTWQHVPLTDLDQIVFEALVPADDYLRGPGKGVKNRISIWLLTLLFSLQIWVWLDGQDYPCRLQADFVGSERILGRDVLNRLEFLFRGPVSEVVINP